MFLLQPEREGRSSSPLVVRKVVCVVVKLDFIENVSAGIHIIFLFLQKRRPRLDVGKDDGVSLAKSSKPDKSVHYEVSLLEQNKHLCTTLHQVHMLFTIGNKVMKKTVLAKDYIIFSISGIQTLSIMIQNL